MELEITNRRTEEFEKDLGNDHGCSMVVTLSFRHWTIKSDEDLRPHIKESYCSWYNCHMHPEKGGELEEAIRRLVPGWDRLPGLSGIRSVSDDGLEMEFCWR